MFYCRIHTKCFHSQISSKFPAYWRSYVIQNWLSRSLGYRICLSKSQYIPQCFNFFMNKLLKCFYYAYILNITINVSKISCEKIYMYILRLIKLPICGHFFSSPEEKKEYQHYIKQFYWIFLMSNIFHQKDNFYQTVSVEKISNISKNKW